MKLLKFLVIIGCSAIALLVSFGVSTSRRTQVAVLWTLNDGRSVLLSVDNTLKLSVDDNLGNVVIKSHTAYVRRAGGLRLTILQKHQFRDPALNMNPLMRKTGKQIKFEGHTADVVVAPEEARSPKVLISYVDLGFGILTVALRNERTGGSVTVDQMEAMLKHITIHLGKVGERPVR